jgi:hypothetical protein
MPKLRNKNAKHPFRHSPLQVFHTGLRWFRSPQVKQYRSIP